MTAQILLDANAVNSWESETPENQDCFLDRFRSGSASLALTDELLLEVLSVAGTRKQDRIPRRAGLLLQIMGNRYLAPFRDIVECELTGRPHPYVSDGKLNDLCKLLREAAERGVPAGLIRVAERIRNEKVEQAKQYRVIQSRFREAIPGLPGPVSHVSLSEYSERYWAKWDPQFTQDLLRDAGDCDPAGSAARVIEESERYPYTLALKKTHVAILHRLIVQNRRVKAGDVYDAANAVYLVGQNTIITDDRGAKELCIAVWGSARQVRSYDEFMNES